MPKGGKRVGSGRKPLTRRQRWLGGHAGHRELRLVERSVMPATAPSEPITVPSMLTPEEAAYWDLWAPLAVVCGSLTAVTVPGFVQLCQQAATADALWACIQSRGYEQEKVTIDGAGQEHREYKANSLLVQWRGLKARIEILQARYGLAADGKHAPPAMEDAEEAALAKALAIR